MKFLLFDLGGVLIDMPGVAKMIEWTGLDERTCWKQWMESTAIAQFESGKLDQNAFAHAVIETFHLPVTAQQFLIEFATWPAGFYPGATAFLQNLRRTHRIGCLTNINAIHWQRAVDEWKVYNYFDFCLASHEIGLVKPDGRIFAHAAKTIGVAPGEILFFDDNLANVRAAADCGLISHQVRGLAELEALVQKLIS